MAKFFLNWLLPLSSFKQELEAVSQKQEKEVKVLKGQIIALEELTSFLASELYTVKVYRLGPFPGGQEGIFYKEVSLSEVSLITRKELFEKGFSSSSGGVNPVSWSGTKWILVKK
ncbi:MAG: hypothetical protein WCG45_00415 [bacterium]